MYKEKFKSPINQIASVIIWAVSVYAFSIIWGIAQILFEFNLEFLKILICIGVTVWFGFTFITRIIPEYEVEITENKLNIYKNMSRRSSLIFSIAINSIIKIYSSKNDLRNHRLSKKSSFVPLGLNEPKAYVVYNSGKDEKCIILTGKKLISRLKKQVGAV